jgi:transcriptional regulator GlxA family with amidase domain
MRERHVVLVAFDGVRLLDVAGPLEAFNVAPLSGAYRTTLVSLSGGNVVSHTGTGLVTAAAATIEGQSIDTLIVPGAVDWRASVEDESLRQFVRYAAVQSRRVASVCAGAFVLAAAGILDGHRAATHWRLADELAARFPQVEVDRDTIHLRSGNVYSSAGVTAGIDLSLALIEEDHGPAVSRAVAQDLVVFMQRPGGQTQFSVRLRTPATDHEPLRLLLDTIVTDPAVDHRLSALSERSGFSERHPDASLPARTSHHPRSLRRSRTDRGCPRLARADRSHTRRRCPTVRPRIRRDPPTHSRTCTGRPARYLSAAFRDDQSVTVWKLRAEPGTRATEFRMARFEGHMSLRTLG